jgi:predicted dehydrogenase
MTPARVLLLGAGAIGRRQAEAVRAAGDRVVAVVDADPVRAAELAAEHSAQVVPSLEAALEVERGYDVAIIATPSPQHLAQGELIAAAGIDVLVEKPHRIPGESAAALRKAIAGSGVRYSVGMTTRHRPGIIAVGEAYRAGQLGELLSYVDRLHYRLGPGDLAPWYFDSIARGGGVLLTNGVHAIDRMRAILDEPPRLVGARLSRVFPDHRCEDSAELSFATVSSAPASISLLWCPNEPTSTGLTVTGTRGVANVGMDGSWSIRTANDESNGAAVDAQEPFDRQWLAVRAGAPGFGLDDLEPTLGMIEQIHEEYSND